MSIVQRLYALKETTVFVIYRRDNENKTSQVRMGNMKVLIYFAYWHPKLSIKFMFQGRGRTKFPIVESCCDAIQSKYREGAIRRVGNTLQEPHCTHIMYELEIRAALGSVLFVCLLSFGRFLYDSRHHDIRPRSKLRRAFKSLKAQARR